MEYIKELLQNVKWDKIAVENAKWDKIALAALVAFGGIKLMNFLVWRSRMMRRFPGPKPSLLLGNIPDFAEAGGFNERFFKCLHEKYGPVASFYLLPNSLNISLEDPADQLEAYKLTEDRPKETYLFLNFLREDTLALSRAADARRLSPHYANLVQAKSQLEEVRRVSFKDYRKLLDSWGEKVVVDVYPELAPIVYNVLGQVLFKKDFLGTSDGDEIYMLHKTLIASVNHYLLVALLPKPICRIIEMLHRGYGSYQENIRKFRGKLDALIEERIQELAAGKYADDESALTILCKQEIFMKDRHRAISSLAGLLNAGYDTVQSAIIWALFHMAQSPKVQEKLRFEIRKKFGEADTPGTMDEVNSCEYLEDFIRESLRMRAIIPVNQRVNLDKDITVNGYLIPKGTNINFPNVVSFRNEKYFGRHPDEFIPERFIGESEQAKKARRYITPFGEWTRMCIGWKFASAEIRCFIIALLQKYRVELDNPDEPGTFDAEAGVNQPFPKFKLRFYEA